MDWVTDWAKDLAMDCEVSVVHVAVDRLRYLMGGARAFRSEGQDT